MVYIWGLNKLCLQSWNHQHQIIQACANKLQTISIIMLRLQSVNMHEVQDIRSKKWLTSCFWQLLWTAEFVKNDTILKNANYFILYLNINQHEIMKIIGWLDGILLWCSITNTKFINHSYMYQMYRWPINPCLNLVCFLFADWLVMSKMHSC